MTLNNSWAVAIVVAAIGAGATIAIADQPDTPIADSQPGISAQAAADPNYKIAEAGESAAEMRKQFSVLRSSPTPPSAALQQSLDPSGQLQAKYGVNFALARAVDSQINGDVWVLPGNGFMCLSVKDPVDGWGQTCQPNVNVAKGFLTLSMGHSPGFPAGHQLMVGVVPDQASTVAIAQSAAPTLPTAVKNNVYAAFVKDPTSMAFTGTEGRPQRLPAYAP